ncbi:MAG TPA: sigma-70 family RNA polymerase sigma factor [Planctomycetota bacterium]
MDPRSAPGPEALLGQADFVRALARSLLADPGAADDVAQEAFVACLERPPAQPGALRGWLASVVRKRASLWRRGEARRAGREASAARAERAPSTAEVVEREAARAAVVRAVLALDEPYRQVVLLRFYEEASPRAIAAGLGLPVETVQTRTKRALAQLRARLDREFGARSAWAALLLPFARPGPAPAARRTPEPVPSPPILAMLIPKLLLPGLTLLLLGLLLRPSVPGTPAASPAAFAGAVTAPAVLAPAILAPAIEPAVVTPGTREPAAPSGAARLQAGGAAALSVTVTWSDGTPAADVLLRVTDVGRSSQAALEGRTSAAGTCRFTDLQAGKALVLVDRKPRSDPAVLRAGEETSLALQIPRGFDLEGVVRAADGAPVAGAQVWMGRSHPPYFLAATSAADGTFRVRSLQPRVGLWARKDGHAPALYRSFRHPEGAVVQEVLELRGPGTSVAGQVLDAEGRPLAGALVLVDGQDMLKEENPLLPPGATGIAYAADSTRGAHAGPVSARTDAEGRFSVGGVRPGTVPLGVLAVGHAPWRGEVEAAAGASATTEVRLARGWTLTGRVLDAHGNPAEGRLTIHGSGVVSLLVPTVEIGPEGSFALHDLPPGELGVWVQGAEDAASTTLRGAAGEEHAWEARLGTASGDGPEFELWDD